MLVYGNQNSQISLDAFDILSFKSSLSGKKYVHLEIAACRSSVTQSGDEEGSADSLTNSYIQKKYNFGNVAKNQEM